MSDDQNVKKDWEYFKNLDLKRTEKIETENGHLFKFLVVSLLVGCISSICVSIIYWIVASVMGLKFSITLGLIGFCLSYFTRKIVNTYGITVIVIAILCSIIFSCFALFLNAIIDASITYQYSLIEAFNKFGFNKIIISVLNNFSRVDGIGLILSIGLPIFFLKKDPLF